MNTLRNDVQNFAQQAGDLLLRGFRKRQDTGRFQTKDIKTHYDRSSELLIKRLIRQKYPDHSILAEETGFDGTHSNYLWIVDPLDGTSNFVNCNPFFSVSIALQVNDELFLAAIYAPFLKEFFFAERGRGAFINSQRIHVSQTDDLNKGYILTCEGTEKNRERIGRMHQRIVSKALDLRKLGSAALECAWVATGRADGFVTTRISPWDVAAGILLVEEAGGKVTDFEGHPWAVEQKDVVVSNGRIHDSLLRMVETI